MDHLQGRRKYRLNMISLYMHFGTISHFHVIRFVGKSISVYVLKSLHIHLDGHQVSFLLKSTASIPWHSVSITELHLHLTVLTLCYVDVINHSMNLYLM